MAPLPSVPDVAQDCIHRLGSDCRLALLDGARATTRATAADASDAADVAHAVMADGGHGGVLEAHRREEREASWSVGVVPRRGHAIASLWWRWAGHLARMCDREPERWVAVALSWRDATDLHTPWAFKRRASDPARARRIRGHREGANRSLDAPTQAVETAAVGEGSR